MTGLPAASPPRPAPRPAARLQLLLRWRLEHWLAWLHLANGPLCLALLLLVPGLSRPLAALLALALTLGALGQFALLRRAPCPARLRLARALGLAIEWAAGLGVIALCAPFPAVPAPGLLLLLLIFSAGRYALRGLLAATAGAWLALLALALARPALPGGQATGLAGTTALHWGLLVGLAALVLGTFLGFSAWWQWRAPRLAAPAPAPDAPLPAGPQPPLAPSPPATAAMPPTPTLSAREAAVLALLARPDLTHEQIADALFIRPSTLKSHVRRLGEKFGVIGRAAIVEAARQRDLLPPAGAPASPETGASGGVDGRPPPAD